MLWPRADYSPIFDRPPLRLPGGARVAVWVAVNVEEWDIQQPMARTVIPAPQGAQIVPDIPNYGWYEYGLRVGIWRIKRVLDRHGIRAGLSLNASVCESYPAIVEACVRAGWEIIGHGFKQRALPLEPDERAVIARTLQTIHERTGQRVRGWMGPGLHETLQTLDILAEHGIEYVCDWCHDDQPYPLRVQAGQMYSIPYTVELNDIVVYLVQHHPSPELLHRTRYAFETLHAEGAESARVLCVSVHPYITGAAHRIGFFDQLCAYLKSQPDTAFMLPGEILDWYREATGATARG
ncbi:MAG: polysaccharide deacetylase family protein [Chloroflexi bacterium]|nr:polysaccharide deacetylase family protein [Chloroflexota bacterium]